MNNLDHVKSFYPENYKMDLSETMKAALSKGPAPGGGSSGQGPSSSHSGLQSDIQQANSMQGIGYVTEKLYMLLQLYLQNKGWNPSIELLQCFSELKDSAMLPSAAHLQVLANRLTLDAQGRLILRDNGKIVLPFEHFANAVMLKHMSGPHGLHLSVEATVRAVVESYTIGRENFGMEKDFIVEVVQSCPSPACRYYKSHMGMPPMPFMDQSYPGVTPDFLQHMPPPTHPIPAEVDLSKGHSTSKVPQIPHLTKQQQNSMQTQINTQHQQQQQQQQNHPQQNHQQQHLQQQQQQQQQQITAAIIQQQNRAIAQQNLEKFGNLSAMEKQRVLQQLDKKHYEPQNIPVPSTSGIQLQGMIPNTNSNQHQQQQATSNSHIPSTGQPQSITAPIHLETQPQKNDILRTNLESLESNKDLLALHNGAWGNQDNRDGTMAGQDKIVRAFAELMRNMTRMKTYIRPSMCKPYGKQSESLQKSLMDTIQLVQSLRNCLPAPHIPVSSWKSEDRHRKEPDGNTRVEN